MKKLLFALFFLPLAGCFDADMTFTVNDDDTATMRAVMSMGPEMYGMIASSGEDPCEEGVGETLADGGYICTIEETDTLDNIVADLKQAQEGQESPMDLAEGFTLERLDGGLVKVAFDLASLGEGAAESGMDPAMMGSMMQAFEGHGMTITVVGKEIVDTNGTLSDDGKSATMHIPLTAIMTQDATLPNSFDVTLKSK